jgi:hypothetical protein
MAAGQLDVLSGVGVISNYLALGAGRAFLINDIEIATAQLWVRPDLGVRTFADLRGKRIATTTKTTRSGIARQQHRHFGSRGAQQQHVSGSRLFHFRRGSRGRALGALQHHGSRGADFVRSDGTCAS